jgi:hypothetical protein
MHHLPMTNFTPDELILFHYGEVTEHEAAFMRDSLEKNWTLREKYNVMAEAAEMLDQAFYSPRTQSVNAILAYAAGTVSKLLQKN